MIEIPREGRVRVVYAKDVRMGGGDAPWTIPAGTRGTAFLDGNGTVNVELDAPVNGCKHVYAEPHKLEAL